MRVLVVLHDHLMWSLGCGLQLRVLLVSVAGRQCRAPDPAGQASSDARETRGRRGAARGILVRGRLKGVTKNARSGETGKQSNAETKDNAPGRRDAQTPLGLHRTDATAPGRGDAYSTGVPEEGEGGRGNVPGYVPTPEDLRFREIYGYRYHGNPGTHLDGGGANDSAWQAWWRDLAVMPSRRYDVPSRKVGRWSVGMLGVKMQGVRDRRWNSERFIVFQTVILQRARHVTASHAIRHRIKKRLDAWGAGKHVMLVGDTLRSCEEYLTAARERRRRSTGLRHTSAWYSVVNSGRRSDG